MNGELETCLRDEAKTSGRFAVVRVYNLKQFCHGKLKTFTKIVTAFRRRPCRYRCRCCRVEMRNVLSRRKRLLWKLIALKTTKNVYQRKELKDENVNKIQNMKEVPVRPSAEGKTENTGNASSDVTHWAPLKHSPCTTRVYEHFLAYIHFLG